MTDRRHSAGPTDGQGPAPVTIYDVARLTGVSPSTVSRALNNPGRLSATTEQRVREVAAAVGYRTNPMARALPTGRTHTVGLVLSDITNPVYFDLVRGVERVAAAGGYILILADTQESADRENETAHRLLASVDGLVLVGTRLADADIRRLAERKPLFLVNRAVQGVQGVVPHVRPGIRQAVEHLAGLGHRSFAYLAGPDSSWMSRHRSRTLRLELRRHRMTMVELGPGLPTLEGGWEALPEVRSSGATAVVAYNDLMATGLLKACRDAAVRVPEELSVIGFDDIVGSDFTSPPLTTIRTPLGLVGDEAARRLIALVEKAEDAPRRLLASEFVLRESTAPPRP